MPIPTEHKGLSVSLLGVVSEESIKKQIGLSGYEIRLCEIVIAPGGTIARHSHAKTSRRLSSAQMAEALVQKLKGEIP